MIGGSASTRRSAPIRTISVSRPGRRAGLSRSQSSTTSSAVAVGPSLTPSGLFDAGEELDVRAAQLARPLADPEHVRRAVVPVAGQRVLPRQRFLVVEHEPLVARPQIDAVEPLRLRDDRSRRRGRSRARARSRRRAPRSAALGRARDELLIPGVHLGEIGEAAVRERADEVERGRGLVVDPEQPGRIRRPRLERRRVVVDHVTEERRQLELARRARSAPISASRTGPRSGRPSRAAARSRRSSPPTSAGRSSASRGSRRR